MRKYLKQCLVYSKPLHIFDILYYNIREIEDVIVKPLYAMYLKLAQNNTECKW